MMPESELSTVGMAASFLTPARFDLLVDYEWGGVDLYDTSQGLRHSLWSSKYENGKIILYADSVSHEVLTVADVTAISFAFDFNMRPIIAYVVNNADCFFYWYNTATQQQETINYGNTYRTPQLALDDHRETQSVNADVIFAYVRDGILRARVQRDRYEIEYTYEESDDLVQIGMMANNRFGFVSKAINVYSYINDLAKVNTRNKFTSALNSLDLIPEMPQPMSFGDNVIRADGSEFSVFAKGKENLVNSTQVSFLVNDADFDYFMCFYRVWQHSLKPFYVQLALDNRTPEWYKCHFTPNTVTMETVGIMYRISCSFDVQDNKQDKDAIRLLARSRN